MAENQNKPKEQATNQPILSSQEKKSFHEYRIKLLQDKDFLAKLSQKQATRAKLELAYSKAHLSGNNAEIEKLRAEIKKLDLDSKIIEISQDTWKNLDNLKQNILNEKKAQLLQILGELKDISQKKAVYWEQTTFWQQADFKNIINFVNKNFGTNIGAKTKITNEDLDKLVNGLKNEYYGENGELKDEKFKRKAVERDKQINDNITHLTKLFENVKIEGWFGGDVKRDTEFAKKNLEQEMATKSRYFLEGNDVSVIFSNFKKFPEKERSNFLNEILAYFDKNKDGKVELAELDETWKVETFKKLVAISGQNDSYSEDFFAGKSTQTGTRRIANGGFGGSTNEIPTYEYKKFNIQNFNGKIGEQIEKSKNLSYTPDDIEKGEKDLKQPREEKNNFLSKYDIVKNVDKYDSKYKEYKKAIEEYNGKFAEYNKNKTDELRQKLTEMSAEIRRLKEECLAMKNLQINDDVKKFLSIVGEDLKGKTEISYNDLYQLSLRFERLNGEEKGKKEKVYFDEFLKNGKTEKGQYILQLLKIKPEINGKKVKFVDKVDEIQKITKELEIKDKTLITTDIFGQKRVVGVIGDEAILPVIDGFFVDVKGEKRTLLEEKFMDGSEPDRYEIDLKSGKIIRVSKNFDPNSPQKFAEKRDEIDFKDIESELKERTALMEKYSVVADTIDLWKKEAERVSKSKSWLTTDQTQKNAVLSNIVDIEEMAKKLGNTLMLNLGKAEMKPQQMGKFLNDEIENIFKKILLVEQNFKIIDENYRESDMQKVEKILLNNDKEDKKSIEIYNLMRHGYGRFSGGNSVDIQTRLEEKLLQNDDETELRELLVDNQFLEELMKNLGVEYSWKSMVDITQSEKKAKLSQIKTSIQKFVNKKFADKSETERQKITEKLYKLFDGKIGVSSSITGDWTRIGYIQKQFNDQLKNHESEWRLKFEEAAKMINKRKLPGIPEVKAEDLFADHERNLMYNILKTNLLRNSFVDRNVGDRTKGEWEKLYTNMVGLSSNSKAIDWFKVSDANFDITAEMSIQLITSAALILASGGVATGVSAGMLAILPGLAKLAKAAETARKAGKLVNASRIGYGAVSAVPEGIIFHQAMTRMDDILQGNEFDLEKYTDIKANLKSIAFFGGLKSMGKISHGIEGITTKIGTRIGGKNLAEMVGKTLGIATEAGVLMGIGTGLEWTFEGEFPPMTADEFLHLCVLVGMLRGAGIIANENGKFVFKPKK